MNGFTYKEIDAEGRETLEAIMAADKFNKWMHQAIAPHCKGKILEIGSGIGNISKFFVSENADITLSDIRENYTNELKQIFPEVKNIIIMDIVHADFETHYKDLLGTFDTIFALNVVEHIKDHDLALKNCRLLLKPGGKMVVLVPAYQTLYNRARAF
jgi:2-polyprenyl-3-methyl-5-hydroxy-6-metoxy-1,4-benzoquinol methylase